MTNMKHLLPLLSLLAFLSLPFPTLAATVSPDDLAPGDLIRGESFSAVYYYGEDGLRYVFPNSKVYFTWYDDFDEVSWLSDADLATIQIGGNVTYKPGIKMVKINSSPRVYAVGAGGILRAIESEGVASELYGDNWNQNVDDIPDGFFGNYGIGKNIELSTQYDPDVEEQDALSVDDDKNLRPFVEINITSDGYGEPTVVVNAGTAIRWINSDEDNHTVTEWNREWGSGTLKPGKHYTHYFRESGTWHYYSKDDDRNVFEGAILVE
jgi:plastocyanin